jgi:hypothetical protein
MERADHSHREGVLKEHKFKVGQTVRIVPNGKDGYHPMPAGKFSITGLLPPDGAENQYRIKSALDGHERVVKEGRLEN